jgi:hypothetical protein
MAGGFSKIVLANVQANTPGGAFQPVAFANVWPGTSTAMAANVSNGSAQYIPAGTYMLPATANVTIEFNAYTGSANNWVTVLANNTGGVVVSDGVAVRANATAAAATSITLYSINGGQAVSGTFNAS